MGAMALGDECVPTSFYLLGGLGEKNIPGSVSWSPILTLSGIYKGYPGDIWLLLC